MICSAREGTEVARHYYQNKIESMHFVEEKKQKFGKEKMIDVIENVSTLIKQSQIEEIRALHEVERYELATLYKDCHCHCLSWLEKRCVFHVDLFQNFRPVLTDTFKKSKTAEVCYSQR